MSRVTSFKRAALLPLASVAAMLAIHPVAHSAAYVFAGEGIEDLITHPPGYVGAGGQLDVNVCIVPGSPNAADMALPLQNIVRTWNRQRATVGNLSSGLATGGFDFESVALHEVGHCVGLAHPNLASESGLAGANRNYTRTTNGVDNVFNLNSGADGLPGSNDDTRGDDGNLHWYNSFLNDPFDPNLLAVIDGTTYRRTLDALPAGDTSVANADRSVSQLARYNYVNTEAVMQQGTFANEAQRTLAADDVAGIRLAQSGLDEVQGGGGDDYVLNLVYQGEAAAPCDINVSFDDTETGFAVCQVSGQILGGSGHAGIIRGDAFFNTGFNWFYNTVSNAEADLSVSLVDSADPVTAGSALTYTTTVTNAGPDEAENVAVFQNFPAGVTFQSSTGCAEDPSAALSCGLGNIAAGDSAQFDVTVTVDASTSGTITHSVSVTSDTTDPANGDNNASESTLVNPQPTAELTITKTDSTDPVIAGSPLVYTITVNNAGLAAANDVTVLDLLPGGVTFVSTVGCAEDPAGLPSCSLGTIAAGGSAQYMVNVLVDVGTSGTITNTASVTSSTAENVTGDNSVMESTVVNPALAPCDLSASPTGNDFGLLTVGQSAQQSVALSNAGQVDCLVNSLAINGSAEFSSDSNAPLVVAAGSQVTVVVTYQPVDGGSDVATLDVDTVSGSNATVALTGRGALVCDVDGNAQIDRLDVRAIFMARNTSSTGPEDRRDHNGDGQITSRDARSCARQCTNSRCSP